MKYKKNLVFQENGEMQHQLSSKLIALSDIPSKWGSQNDMFQQLLLWGNSVISAVGETTTVKKMDTMNWGKIQVYTFKKSLLLEL